MKITCTKSGNFSFDPIYGPIFSAVEGVEYEFDEREANQLINAGWAKPFTGELPPWKTEEWNPYADDAKQILEDYCISKFSKPLDKRKNVSTLIREVKRLIKEND